MLLKFQTLFAGIMEVNMLLEFQIFGSFLCLYSLSVPGSFPSRDNYIFLHFINAFDKRTIEDILLNSVSEKLHSGFEINY